MPKLQESVKAGDTKNGYCSSKWSSSLSYNWFKVSRPIEYFGNPNNSGQVSGRNQYVGRGKLQFAARGSAAAATGIRATLNCGGIALMDDQLVTYAGTAGALSIRDHMLVDQSVAGGRVELFFRNDSAGIAN